MAILIDGNNLLHAARDIEDPERPLGRAQLCQILADWATRVGVTIQLVFDGPQPPDGFAEQIRRQSGLEVRFSGGGVRADDVLIAMIDADSSIRRKIVVSSDREIARAARRRKAKAERSEAFWRRVRRDRSRQPEPRPSEPDQKRSGLGPDDLDDWLRTFGMDQDP